MNGTSCEKCIFTEWSANGAYQVGCKAGRVDKFLARGERLELIKTDKVYVFIHDRICTMCCQKDLLERKPELKINPLIEIRKRIALQCDALVLVEEHSIEEIQTTIDSLLVQEHKPAKITVVINSNNQKPQKITRLLKDSDIPWQITNIDERGPDNELVSMEWCVDHVIKASTSPFYCLFMSGFQVPLSFLKSIDVAMNDELHKFAVLIPIDDWNATFCQVALHNRMGGFAPMVLSADEEGNEVVGMTVFDKAHYFAEQEGEGYMVRKAVDICTDLAL